MVRAATLGPMSPAHTEVAVGGGPFPLTRVVAMINQKGGVGKTTTTVNLAAGLALLGRPTLLIDLDPQGHATAHLGAAGADGPTVYDALLEPARARDALVRARDNLWLLPADVDLAAAETDLAGAPDRERRLERAVAPFLDRFEFVLIDCPPSLGLLTLNALALAREVIAPMQAHFLALQGVGRLMETVRLVGKEVNPRLRISGVVLCMHEEATKLSKEVVADLEAFFEGARETDVPWKAARVLRPAIRRNVKLAEAPSFGQTIYEYAPTASGASDYRALAETFAREWDALRALRGGAKPEVRVTNPGLAAPASGAR